MQARMFIVVLSLLLTGSLKAVEITGAGSTFVYPLISQWAATYKDQTGHSINYQSIGSGGGIKMIESSTVDFGASDKPLKTEELAQKGLVQFPIVSGAIVPVINIDGVTSGTLKLTGPLIADIYMGKITKWNDPSISKVNPTLTLPDQPISVVHRSDGSGSTFIWTNYLSKISPEWKSKVGEDSSVKWPTGVGAKGNEGVATNIKQIKGSIGYVEYAYALQTGIAIAQVQNSTGAFITPDQNSFAAAAKSADWAKAKDYYLILTNAPGKDSWPIAGTVFVLMQKKQANLEKAQAALSFFNWAYKNGATKANELHYVPVPDSVATMVNKTWKNTIKSSSGAQISIGL